MSVIITGVKEFQAGLSAMMARQDAATRVGLGKCLLLLQRDIQASLALTSSTGEQGRDKAGRFTKRAPTEGSPPGTPPFLRSGDLRRSVQSEGPKSLGQQRYEGMVAPTIEYARIHELGGTTGRGGATHLPPRPYVKPALDRMIPVMGKVMKDAWATALKG